MLIVKIGIIALCALVALCLVAVMRGIDDELAQADLEVGE